MKIIAPILVFLILSSGCIGKSEGRKTALRADIIFQNNCAGCHGQGGGGGTGVAPPLKGSNFIKTASEHEIKNVIENGRGYDVKRYKEFASYMPAFSGQLTSQEIEGLVSYLKSL